MPNLGAAANASFAFQRGWKYAASLTALAALAGCASFPTLQASPLRAPTQNVGEGVNAEPVTGARAVVDILNAPSAGVEAAQNVTRAAATAAEIEALLEPRDVEVALPPQPLTQFVDTVFGEILRVPYSTGPGVSQRREMIALRGPTMISNRRFFVMAQMALAQYGLAVMIENGGVRIVQDAVLSGQSPVFIRTRTAPDTPSSSRPVMQFFSVSALGVSELVTLLDQAYPNRGSVRFAAQPDTNTLLISGTARDVASAATVVRQLDRPHFAGGQIARVQPVFLSTEQLAESLTRVLATEGYRVSNPIEAQSNAITLLPIQYANQLLIFANDPDLFERALYWIGELDRASALGDADGVFVYTAQNTSAEELGALVAQASAATRETAASAPLPPEMAVRRVNGVRAGGQSEAPRAGPTTIGALTIDPGGNRLLFRGSPSEFERLRALLEQLDTPPQQVLIELTIAEVTLTDETRFGVEWFLERSIDGGDLTASTRGGSVRQPGGLGVTAARVFSRGTVEAALNAFASNRNLNILSTPRVFTRSGSEAQILIGTDVPIITSQRASNNQTGGDTDVLQTVQYRQTGVILNARPVVYGDGRIDITLYQEVSSQQPNTSAAINSPLILNRSVSTQISLQEGMTAVIGGMIQDNFTRNQRGIPGLKDIPFLGAAFRSEEVSGDKVELVILVTPYIVRDGEDMSAITESMTGSVNRALRRRGAEVYTLYPWRAPFEPLRTHNVVRRASPTALVAPAPELAPPVAAPELAAPADEAPEQTAPQSIAPPPGGAPPSGATRNFLPLPPP